MIKTCVHLSKYNVEVAQLEGDVWLIATIGINHLEIKINKANRSDVEHILGSNSIKAEIYLLRFRF